MAKKLPPATLTCAVDYAFQRLGGKYKGRLLSRLRQGPLRYGQLRRLLPEVTPKMLTQALRELEEDQLVSRQAYGEVPPRVEYVLTESGRELLPLLDQLKDWGEHQMRAQGLRAVVEPPPPKLPP